MKAVVYSHWAVVKEVVIARDDAHAQELIALQGGDNALAGRQFQVVELVDHDKVLDELMDKAWLRGINQASEGF